MPTTKVNDPWIVDNVRTLNRLKIETLVAEEFISESYRIAFRASSQETKV